VSFNGQPIQAGQVMAYAEANQAVGIATIQAGEYSLTDLPLGPVLAVGEQFMDIDRFGQVTIELRSRQPFVHILSYRPAQRYQSQSGVRATEGFP
jgi:hypothetical protein